MILPIAPLYPWLLHAIMFDTPMCARPNGQRARLVGIQRSRANGPTQYQFAEHRAEWTNETPDLDLRHGPTRYAVLRALADAGHSRPWALGAPWSPLNDEQAGRAAAEIVRAVGEDPGKPVGVVPVCVLGRWTHGDSSDDWSRQVVLGDSRQDVPSYVSSDDDNYVLPSRGKGWGVAWYSPRLGPETGEPGRLAADTAARALGRLMIEDMTS